MQCNLRSCEVCGVVVDMDCFHDTTSRKPDSYIGKSLWKGELACLKPGEKHEQYELPPLIFCPVCKTERQVRE